MKIIYTKYYDIFIVPCNRSSSNNIKYKEELTDSWSIMSVSEFFFLIIINYSSASSSLPATALMTDTITTVAMIATLTPIIGPKKSKKFILKIPPFSSTSAIINNNCQHAFLNKYIIHLNCNILLS